MTDIRFVAPDLRRLDEAPPAEVLACGIFADERPFGGLAGLVDWRLAGRLASLARSDFLTGEEGEALLVPVAARFPFDKLLVLGLGAKARFDEDVFRRAMARFTDVLRGLAAKTAVIELPGRSGDHVPVERAARMLQDTPLDEALDAVSLVETPDAQRAFERETTEARRLVSRGVPASRGT